MLENWFGKGNLNISVNTSLASRRQNLWHKSLDCGIVGEAKENRLESYRAKGLASWFVGFDFFNALMMGHGSKFMTFCFSHRLIENYF